ncbi:hypothetical protein J1N35_031199 [Gossypium stocksii]|uniref:Uncharacterized protein n=1 Tax=Gossypium stocksii TaxID=47602 RepID=A0A9D3V1E2_9ROSI|nr:hypothetical protein J1N35_031199 [Gossypium stocksii]
MTNSQSWLNIGHLRSCLVGFLLYSAAFSLDFYFAGMPQIKVCDIQAQGNDGKVPEPNIQSRKRLVRIRMAKLMTSVLSLKPLMLKMCPIPVDAMVNLNCECVNFIA